MKKKGIFVVVTLALALLLFTLTLSSAQDLPLDKIKLPAGFKIEVYASDLPGARSMTLSPEGVLFVGTRGQGNIYAVIDNDQDQRADQVMTIARGLSMPNGVAFSGGSLYVAEVHRVIRFDQIMDHLPNVVSPVVVNDSFPRDFHHGWKFIRISPDNQLYVPVGAPCNICEKKDPRYASIMRMNLDGSELEVFANGIRNTVGFDWHPKTQELWFTDNGRDRLGDNSPPDELNHAPNEGLHFGYPYLHGRNTLDPKFGKKGKGKNFALPAQELGPHVAALGMRFYDKDMFPDSYRNQIFIAEHGSWNRSTPLGYRITIVELDERGISKGYRIFAEGWLQGNRPWGRPVDVLVMPDGALLVSDDHAGVIYRISYKK